MRKSFSNFRPALFPLPNLVSIQTDSYNWFIKEGLRELLEEISPIKDSTGKAMELSFLDYHFDEPKYDEIKAKEHNASYEAPLRCKLSLLIKKSGEIKEQEVYLGDFPVMTNRGTFLVNGVERVVVSQLIRSPGVFFTANTYKRRRLFGAKVIPNRGAWLEFETDPADVIYVRIDRKRKVPVSSLLRIFGMETNDEIQNIFKDVDTSPNNHYIKSTLEKDLAKNKSESFIEIYKRIRPGDLATVDNAKQLIEGMFFNFSRYDLSRVGRYKFNQRLGLKTPEDAGRILNKEDIIKIIREIIQLNNNPRAKTDDIDHLGNRRVRPLGELLQNKLRVGLTRMERIIKDRMTTLDVETLTPAQLLNIRPFLAVVKEFFTSSQLSQFMDQVNPLAELEHKRRLSTMGPGGLTRERAGFEVRDVHPSFYGRICPIQTPEGQNIGLISHLSSYAKLNKYGFIETPYRRVKNGKITDEIIYMNASEEEKYNIAEASVLYDKNGRFVNPRVAARIKGEPGMADKSDIDFIDVAPNQSFSVATSLIPFLEHDDANRALMGSNMQRQAVSCVRPQAPLVGTGIEEKAAFDSGQVVIAEQDGIVKEVDASHILIENKDVRAARNRFTNYWLHNFTRSNQFTSIHHRPLARKGNKVKKGQVIADGASTDNGELALGQNVLVAFMSWAGANFEDAVIISEKLVQDDRYSSIHIENHICDVRDTKLGPEFTTPDIPNVGEEKLKDLDEDGIVRIGAEVGPLSILVGKISPKGEADLTSEERLLRAIFGEKARDVKDTSLTLPHGKHGRVVGIRILSREKGDKLPSGVIKSIQVDIAQLRKISAGDKLAGRHGNKGVISKILPVEDMPYLKDGTPVDIVLNPLGVASRMNIGQILETHLGLAAQKLNYKSLSPALNGVTEEDIKIELKKAGFNESGKMTLYDGRTGEKFNQPVTVGYIYMMKLHHLVEDKIHMRSIGPYSLITQQPLGGKAQFGGQRFGEMEVWALEGYGAAHTLQEMITIKSDDVLGRSAAYDSIIRNRPIRSPNIPASFYVLLNELKGLCLDAEMIDEKGNKTKNSAQLIDFKALKLGLASPERILEWSHGEVTKPETINYRTQKPEKDGLFCEKIFGPEKDWECYCGKYRRIRYKGVVCDKCGVEVTRAIVRRERMGHIQLAAPVSHLWFLRGVPSRIGLLLNVSLQELERVIYFASYIVTKVDEAAKRGTLLDLEKEYKTKVKQQKTKKEKEELFNLKEKVMKEIENLRPLQILSESDFYNLSLKYAHVFEADLGASAVRRVLENINLEELRKELFQEIAKTQNSLNKKALKRLRLVEGLIRAKIRPEWMVLTHIPVIPPDLRPMVQLDGGRYATSDVNDLYRRVINRNNRLKKLIELNAPEIICRNEKRMLQEAVDALLDNSARHTQGTVTASTGQKRPLKSLADMLKGKQGRFRQNLLGKRVDYSGRSVIIVGPELNLFQCGLPKKMALELFRPFVINKLIEKEFAYNIRGAGRLIEQEVTEVWEILEEVIRDKYVLLNRAPTLHRLGIQAFSPVLIGGEAIQIHPLVCAAFNADFDGDQMAVHLPLTREAQSEAREIMLSSKNIFKPSNGEPIAIPTKDIVLGCYWMTKIQPGLSGEDKIFANKEDAILAYQFRKIDLRAKIKVRVAKPLFGKSEKKINQIIETCVGRILFNEVLPQNFEFINQVMNKKILRLLINDVIDRYGIDETGKILDHIKDLGFKYATKSGISWGMDDLQIPEDKYAILEQTGVKVREIKDQYNQGFLTEEERRSLTISAWFEAANKISQSVFKALEEFNPVYTMVDSGSRGSWPVVAQLMGMRGLMANPAGETIELPVKRSFKEGLSVLEYFISTHGARKGTADTALKTATAGYLTRRLVDVAQDIVVRQSDCGDKEGINIWKSDGEASGYEFSSRINGRHIMEDIKNDKGEIIVKKGEWVTKETAQKLTDLNIDKARVRSVITCKTKYGVCQKCYGYDLGRNQLIQVGEAIGIVTAQAIGEPGTQLTMRTFHTGGVAGEADITQGLPRVEEIFEARIPKGKALISECDGKVVSVKEENKQKIIKIISSDDFSRKKSGKTDRSRKQARESQTINYVISSKISLMVSEGDLVYKGQRLCDGNIDLKELFRVAGKEAVQRYILREIQGIYSTAGDRIHDKHLEIIIKQMFSRVRIQNEGDTRLLPGDIVEKDYFDEENEKIIKGKKKPATAEILLLGITKVALTTSSFLSAASFQETARVLIKATVEGKEDRLRGLKENVIIGKLIPAGTGFKSIERQKVNEIEEKE